jgi:hypothetical protein
MEHMNYHDLYLVRFLTVISAQAYIDSACELEDDTHGA